jgi:Tol biopolymer transport system component
MVIDGQLVGRYSSVSAPTWSDDGRRIAFIGTNASGDELVVDGRVTARAGRIDPYCLSFSPDARRLAYFEERPRPSVVVDGERQPLEPGARCRRPAFSPDGRHVVYVVYAYDGHDTWEHVAVDGELGPAYRLITEPGFTPDGDVCFTGIKRHVGEVLVVGGQESAGYDRIETEAFWDPMGGSWPACPLAFSPDGKHRAYGVAKGGKGWVVLDGQKGPTFLEVGEPMLSPDGGSVAYRAEVRKDEWTVALDGRPGPTFRDVWGKSLFSPDGKRLAYVARCLDRGVKLRLVAVVDGKPSPTHESVSDLSFSPDSRHTAYVARDADREWVVLDGQNGPQYDEVLRPRPSDVETHLAFRPDGSAEYVAQRGDTIYRVRQFPPEPGA